MAVYVAWTAMRKGRAVENLSVTWRAFPRSDGVSKGAEGGSSFLISGTYQG